MGVRAERRSVKALAARTPFPPLPRKGYPVGAWPFARADPHPALRATFSREREKGKGPHPPYRCFQVGWAPSNPSGVAS